MDHVAVITLLYIAGLLLLAAEIFVPSHGLLTIGALVCLGVAVYHTFARNTTAGVVGTICCLILVPSVLMLGVKYVRYLPLGDRLAPPNPRAENVGRAFDRSDCEALVGRIGRTVTPLHPVGVCEFDGRRVQCVAESGMVDAKVSVIGVGVQVHNLVVRPHASDTAET